MAAEHQTTEACLPPDEKRRGDHILVRSNALVRESLRVTWMPRRRLWELGNRVWTPVTMHTRGYRYERPAEASDVND